MADERRRRRIVANDVDFFAAQVVGHVGDPARLRTKASADRIDFGPVALHRNLRTASGIARDRHDLDRAVGDFGNLELQQALHEPLGRARKNHLRPLRRFLHVEHVRANEVVDAIGLARDLFVEIHDGFVATFERDEHVALLVALHRAGHQVVELAHVLVVDGVALGFANALDDDLLGRLRGDSPEVFRRDFFIEEIAHLIRLARPLSRRSRASDPATSSTTVRR